MRGASSQATRTGRPTILYPGSLKASAEKKNMLASRKIQQPVKVTEAA
jgi:hypothetical protein